VLVSSSPSHFEEGEPKEFPSASPVSAGCGEPFHPGFVRHTLSRFCSLSLHFLLAGRSASQPFVNLFAAKQGPPLLWKWKRPVTRAFAVGAGVSEFTG
jgi:hypothetical protein